ncbi:hypothetical protein ACFC1R_14825 [Kitasatospora sp. NPDC056138]|uniref:hypothetical protein n=1 Tax=Kitasatospora sp. NPDC056138 TaxID=3345724 RepID=UPI0035D563BE
MADTNTSAAAPAVPQQSTPVEHTSSAAGAQPILDVLQGLADGEPEAQGVPAQEPVQPKKDGGFEPLGNVINHP